MYFLFKHSRGEVVNRHKHRPGAMRAALVAKQIESIGAHSQPEVSWFFPETFEFNVYCFPLGCIRRVCQHNLFPPVIIYHSFLLPFCVPAHELRFLTVREITLQPVNERKVPHHFSRSFRTFLVSVGLAHWTNCVVCVLVPINDAIKDAGVVFNVG